MATQKEDIRLAALMRDRFLENGEDPKLVGPRAISFLAHYDGARRPLVGKRYELNGDRVVVVGRRPNHDSLWVVMTDPPRPGGDAGNYHSATAEQLKRVRGERYGDGWEIEDADDLVGEWVEFRAEYLGDE